MQEKSVLLNFKIGIIKELYKQELLTEKQAKQAIEILKQDKKERTVENEACSRLLQGIDR